MYSNTASSIMAWFMEGVPRTGVVRLPSVLNLLECSTMCCSTFCVTVEVLSEKSSLVGVVFFLGKGFLRICNRSECDCFTTVVFVRVLSLLEAYDFASSKEKDGIVIPWLANEVGTSVTRTKVPLCAVCVNATAVCKSCGTQEKVIMSTWCIPVGR